MKDDIKIEIDNKKCIKCGSCSKVCPAKIYDKSTSNEVILKNTFLCIKCSDCVSVCPKKAITHAEIKEEKDSESSYVNNEFSKLIRKRRTLRNFKNIPLTKEEKEYLHQAACLSPRGGHSKLIRNTGIIMVEDKELINELVKYGIEYLLLLNKKLNSPLVKIITTMNKSFKESISNTVDRIEKVLYAHNNNINMLTYDAPTIILLYSEKDTAISYENALICEYQMMLAAESINLGSCFLGWLSFSLQGYQVKNIKKLKQIYNQLGIMKNKKISCAFSIGKNIVEYRTNKTHDSLDVKYL
jgi:ferredoxin